MKRFNLAAIATIAGTGTALAGGLDRSGQNINVIFEDGNHVEFSLGWTSPDVSGTGSGAGPLPAGTPYNDVANNFTQGVFGIKTDINEALSFAIIGDQPFGADVFYPGNPAATELAGTFADLESYALTYMLRYKFGDRYSVHGGLRQESIKATLGLGGVAYGGAFPAGLNGYNLELQRDTDYGFSLGAAYEIPEIALRVAVTYHSSIEHEFDTIEGGSATGSTKVDTPQAVNIDFQTGVAADTLVFGSVRWADYSETKLSPNTFRAITTAGGNPNASLIGLDDSWAYTLGVGRRFNDAFSGSLSLAYETGDNDLVSPLGPTDGVFGVTVGGQYTIGQTEISGGVRYSWIGDARPATANTERAQFSDNSAVSVGLKVAYKF